MSRSDVVDAGANATLARRPVMRKGTLGLVVTYGTLAIFAFLVLFPLAWMAITAFKPSSEIVGQLGFWPREWTIDNFVTVFGGIGHTSIWTFFINSTILAAAAVIGTVLSSSLAAYAFARVKFRASKVYFAILIGSLLLPGHVLIVPQYILFQRLGMIDTFLPLIIPKFLATEAFFVFLIVQFIRGIPREIDEAARLDGCGHWRIYWTMILPLVRPALVTSSIFAFIWSWNDFLGPLLYLNSPEKFPLPLALNIFNDQTSSSNYGATIAISALALLPVALFFIVFQRYLVDGVATQGLKG